MDAESSREAESVAEATIPKVPGWARGLLSVGILAACGALLLVAVPREDLPVGDAVPAFQLTDQDGDAFDSGRLQGNVWVASFIFTRCRASCPGMSGNLLLVQDAVKADPELASCVRLVSFSVDPERDKPRDLKEYATNYGADTAIWSFLTGGDGAVAKLCQEGFRLPLGKAPLPDGKSAAPDIVHSDRFALVDADGRTRGFFRPEPADQKRLLRALKTLAASAATRPKAP
jgi:protein SCO1/2